VGLRVVLDVVVKRKVLSPCRDSNPNHLNIQPAAQRYTTELLASFKLVVGADNQMG
jgi:hypothetical protein